MADSVEPNPEPTDGTATVETRPAPKILDETSKQDIRNYLNKEIRDVRGDAGRQDRMDRNGVIERQRWIRPETKTKDFPWDDAANTVPPLMWTKLSSVVNKFSDSILNKNPIFVYKSTDPAYADHAAAITRHIESIMDDPNQAGFRKTVWPMEFDKASFGTVFIKVPFEIEERYFTRADPESGALTDATQLVRSCPKPYVIPFEDFFTRAHWWDIQKAPWIAVRNYKYFHELKTLETQEYYEDVDMIWGRNQRLDDHKVNRLDQAGISEEYNNRDPNKIFEIYEVNLFWDIKGDGKPQDIVVHYEQESNTILRVEYNDLGRRDIVRIPYVEFNGILYGMGIGDMLSSLQDMIETVFNTSFNSEELSYMGVVVTRQGSGIGFGKDVYPGATIEVPNVKEDLNLLEFPSSTANAMMLQDRIEKYGDEATGATSMMVGGQPQGEGNRIGATGTQYLGQRGDTYLSSFLDQSINGYAEIGELMLLQLVRNRNFVNMENIPKEDIPLLTEVYATPVEQIAQKFRFSISMADIQQEADKRNDALVMLFQLYGAFSDRMVQYVGVMSDPSLAQQGMERMQELMMTSVVGFSKLFERILKSFDEQEIGDFLMYYKDMELVLELADKQKEATVEQARTQINSATSGVGGAESGLPGESPGNAPQLGTGVQASPPGGVQPVPGTGNPNSDGGGRTTSDTQNARTGGGI